jgi:hypothetical protein
MATITTENIARFKRAYNKALKTGKESFMFEGNEVLVSFAKYVIEYAERNKK